MAAIQTNIDMSSGVNYTYTTNGSADWSSVPNDTYFYDLSDRLVRYKNSDGNIIGQFESFTGNTSGSCINDFWVSNIHGCSPINIININDTIGAQTYMGDQTSNYLLQETSITTQFSNTETYTGFKADNNGNSITMRSDKTADPKQYVDFTDDLKIRYDWGGDATTLDGSTDAITVYGNGDGVEFHGRTFHNEVVETITGSTYTADLTTANMFKLTAASNFELDYSGGKSGTYIFIIEQDVTGSRDISFAGSKFRTPGGVEPKLTSAAGSVDILSCIYSEEDSRMYIYDTYDFQDI